MSDKQFGKPGYASAHLAHLKKLDDEEVEYRARFGAGRFDAKNS